MRKIGRLVVALIIGAIALAVGLPAHDEGNWFPIMIIGYSLFDLAFITIAFSACALLSYPIIQKPLIPISIQSYVILKILVRISTESPEDTVKIDSSDELFYIGSLMVFFTCLWEQRTQQTSASELAEPVSPVTVRKLLGLVKDEKILLSSAIVCLVVAAVAHAAVPHYIGQALDSVKDRRPVSPALLGLLYSSSVMALFSTLRGSSFMLLGARVNVNLRSSLFKAILRQDMGFFDLTKTGDLSSRLTQDCQKVCDQVQLNVNYFVRHVISLIVTLGFMFGLSWRLTCLAMISIPFTAILVHYYGEIIKKISKEIQDKLADCNAASEETLSSIRTVRSFAAENFEASRFSDLLIHVYKASKRSAICSMPYMTLSRALPYVSLLLIVFYGSKLAVAGIIDSGLLISFVLYLDILNGCFTAIGDIYGSITAALGAADKVFSLLERKPSFPAIEFPLAPPRVIDGNIEFKNVLLSYPSRPEICVLNGISLTVPAGKVVALVGGSGQGKSSCLGLLQRWYLQSQGEVLLDNVPVRKYDVEHYHQLVTCVNQEPLLFARTIRENILFGIMNPGELVSEEMEQRVIECAKLANAHDFICRLPDGYDTQVGMRGVQLSGGQKQRIAIARGLVRKPKILLLDEATSALDSESEKQVQSALDSMMTAELTMIIVAHRLSTVRHADCIYVIERGAVVEKGTHDELIRDEKSAYFKLVQSQLSH